MDVPELIAFIVWYATTRGEVLTPIRLVKFLYLLDLYFARELGGRTLTGWPWAFVHYGPFCGQALNAIEVCVHKGIIEARPYTSQYDGEQHFVYSLPRKERPIAAHVLPARVLSTLEEAIRKWGGDTAGLLDHVYFETEPMLAAGPGDRLDFSSARWAPRHEPVAMKKLRPEAVKQGKELLARLRERTAGGLARSRQEAEGEIRDAAYATFLKALEPAAPAPNIEGVAILEPPPPPPRDEQP